MSGVSQILHFGLVNGRTLRFVRSPLQHPDFPWHVVDDLFQVACIEQGERIRLLRDMADQYRQVAVADAILTIAPHAAALGFLDVVAERGGLRLRGSYLVEAFAATENIIGAWPSRNALRWVVAASEIAGIRGEAS